MTGCSMWIICGKILVHSLPEKVHKWNRTSQSEVSKKVFPQWKVLTKGRENHWLTWITLCALNSGCAFREAQGAPTPAKWTPLLAHEPHPCHSKPFNFSKHVSLKVERHSTKITTNYPIQHLVLHLKCAITWFTCGTRPQCKTAAAFLTITCCSCWFFWTHSGGNGLREEVRALPDLLVSLQLYLFPILLLFSEQCAEQPSMASF